MPRLLHGTWILVMLIVWGAGSARGQSVNGYRFATGVDSTLWVDMTDAQMYVPPTEEIPIGFDFFFCGMFYRRVSVGYYGVIYFENSYTELYGPTAIFQVCPPPLMDPFVSFRTISPVYMKMVEESGGRKFIVELRVQVEANSNYVERPIQVQLSEQDGSILYLYGDPGNILQPSNFQIGFRGADSAGVYVNLQEHAVSEPVWWNTNFKDWPGYYRYYRFTPDSLPCCSNPFDVRIESVSARTATLVWNSSVYQTSFEVHYRPIDMTQPWRVVTTPLNTIELGFLEPTTEYEYRVYALCGNGCKSRGIAGQFFTQCTEEDGNQIQFFRLEGDDVECRWGFFTSPSSHVGLIDDGPENVSSRHTVHTDTSELDPRTNNMLHTVPPGHCYSVRLGNWNPGSEEESITYHLDVDTNLYDLLILRYAIVEENPGHEPEGQPRF